MSFIAERVLDNPEIPGDSSAFIEDLVTRAKNHIVTYCCLNSFPELSYGYFQGFQGASEDLTDLEDDSILVSVNGSPYYLIHLDLANCDTGAHTAAELQSQIQNENDYYGVSEVTVSFDSDTSSYRVSSGQYGEDSRILFDCYPESRQVSRAMKLAAQYGGRSYPGNWDHDTLQDAAVQLVEMYYRKIGLEGLQSGSIPGGMSFSAFDMPEALQAILATHRRVYAPCS